MSKKGEPVMHIYIIFIACCLIYGAHSLYKYVEYLEETIEEQNHAIELKNQETMVMKMYIERLNTYNSPPNFQQSFNPLH